MKTSTILAAFSLLTCSAVLAAEPVSLAADLLPPQPILVADEPLAVEGFAAPCFADFDGDGDWDLVIGTGYGVSRNLGTIAQPQFEMTQPLLADGEPLTVGLPPCIADWDGDGLSDLIVGTHNQIRWHRNVGQPGKPTFGPAEILVGDSNASFPEGHFHAVDVVDFNGDGKMDLLVGDSKYISEPHGSPPPQHLAQSHAQASEALREIQRVKLPETASHAQQIAYHQELLKRWQRVQLTRASNGRREGRVWVYARSGP